MSRGRKLTKAEKRERRQRAGQLGRPPFASTAERIDPLTPVVTEFYSGAATVDTALSLCMSRLDDLINDVTVARIAHGVWKDRPGPAAPLATHLAELVDELRRHGDQLRDLHDRFTELSGSEALPELSQVELAAALAQMNADTKRATNPTPDPDLP